MSSAFTVLRPVLHAARPSGAKHGVMVGWVFDLRWGQTNARPSRQTPHPCAHRHPWAGQPLQQLAAGSGHPPVPAARTTPLFHDSSASYHLAWPGLPSPCPPPCMARCPQLAVECPSTRGGPATGTEERGLPLTALFGSALSCSFCSRCLVPSRPSACLWAQRLSLLPPATAW